MAVQPQSNYLSNQNYDADIVTLYKHYVTGSNTPSDKENGQNVAIDDIRAHISVSVTGMNTSDLIAALNINPTTESSAPTPNTTAPVLSAQESRCHAFYRILGLPVVASNGTDYYNPGFDIIKQQGVNRQMTLDKKITIAGNVGAAFEKISSARENWVANTSRIFSLPTSVEAGVLSLTSGTYGFNGSTNNGITNIRAFNVLTKVTQPFDYEPSHQTFSVLSQSCLVGDNGPQLLEDFQDAAGNSIIVDANGNAKTRSNTFFTHQHIVAPFNVDPRIDFSIWGNNSSTSQGLCRRVAVPFVPDASYLQANSTGTAVRPVIEQIIRIRIFQANQIPAAGDAIANAQVIIQNDPNIGKLQFMGSTPLSNIFSGNVFNLSQQNAFADTLSSIQTMIKKLTTALQKVQSIEGIYYWLPIPNTTGPEGGFQVRDPILSKNFSSSLITASDLDVLLSQTAALFSNLTTSASQANAIPDPGGYAFSAVPPTPSFNKNSTDALGDLSSRTMDTLTTKRSKDLQDAGQALQIVEMIMGEFSGLGLCDIIAMMGALYTIPLADLLGLLDPDAYARAQTALGSSIPAQTTSITSSMTSLLQAVSSYYQIMDQIFLDTFGNQSLSQ